MYARYAAIGLRYLGGKLPEQFSRADWKAARTCYALIQAEADELTEIVQKEKGSTEGLLLALLARRW